MTHRIFDNKIFEIVGEVAVYESDVPRAHKLLRYGSRFIAIPVNDIDTLTHPADNAKLGLGFDDAEKIEIVWSVLNHHFGPSEIWGTKNRQREYVVPRQIFVWAVKNSTKLTLARIGKLLPMPCDHATVLNSSKKVEHAIETNDKNVIPAVEQIAEMFCKYGFYGLSDHIKELKLSHEIMRTRVQMGREVL